MNKELEGAQRVHIRQLNFTAFIQLYSYCCFNRLVS